MNYSARSPSSVGIDFSTRASLVQTGGSPPGAKQQVKTGKVVCFGDILSIYRDERSNSKFGPKVYISADGFYDGSCWLQPGPQSDFTDCLFRVVIKQSSSATQNLQSKLDQLVEDGGDRLSNEMDLDNLSSQLKNLGDEEKHAIMLLAQEARTERLQNEYETQRSKGVSVAYGQIVQLQHCKSGKFLTRCGQEMADADSNSNKVILKHPCTQDAWFRMEPRFKTADELVKYGDPVIISAGKSDGQVLQYCKVETKDAIWKDSGISAHEVTAAASRISWKLHSFMPWESELSTAVKAGDVVRIFHQDKGAFLYFGEDKDQCGDQVGKVYLRPDRCTERMKSGQTSAMSSFWRIESEEATAGGFICYGSGCRLRHLLTGKYIAVQNGHSTTPTTMSDHVHPRTLLTVMSNFDAKRSPTALNGKENRIRWAQPVYFHAHVANAFLIAGESDMSLETGSYWPELQRAPLFCQQDSFAFNVVSESDLSDFYHFCSAAYGLRAYTTYLKKQGALQNERVEGQTKFNDRFCSKVLGGLIESLSTAYTRKKEDRSARNENSESLAKKENEHSTRMLFRQDLCRSLKILKSCMDIAADAHRRVASNDEAEHGLSLINSLKTETEKTSTQANKPFAKTFRRRDHTALAPKLENEAPLNMLKLSHSVLTRAVDSNDLNACHLASFVDELQHQLSSNLSDETTECAKVTLMKMLMASNTLKETVPQTLLEFFLIGIEGQKVDQALYVDFLSILASSGDTGIRRNQNFILKHWLKDRKRSQLLFTTSSPEKGVVQVSYLPTEQEKLSLDQNASRASSHKGRDMQVVDLDSFCASAVSNYNSGSFYLFYEATIKLFASLCKGVNLEAQTIIRDTNKYVTYNALLQCIANERLPFGLRENYVSLMHHLFVARLPFDRTTLKQSVFTLAEASDHKSECNEEFNALKSEILTALTKNHSISLVEFGGGRQSLVLTLILLCKALILLGIFASNEEISKFLLPILMSMLDSGQRAVSTLQRTSLMKPFHDDLESNKVHGDLNIQIQSEVLQILDLLLDLRFNSQMRIFLDLFQDASSTVSKEHAFRQRAKSIIRHSLMSNSVYGIKPALAARSCYQSKEYKLFKTWIRDVGEKTLREKVLSLVFAQHEYRLERVLKELIHSKEQRIATFALHILMRVKVQTLEIFRGAETMCLALGSIESSACSTCRRLTAMISKVLPILHMLVCDDSGILMFPEQQQVIPQIVIDLKSFRELIKQSSQVQEIIQKLSMQKIVLEVISKYYDPCGDLQGLFALSFSTQTSRVKDKRTARFHAAELLAACFRFLEDFCAGCQINQESVAPYALSLLQCANNGFRVISTLSAIYRDNFKLCETIDMRILHYIVEQLSGKKGVAPRRRPHYIKFLHMLCRCQDRDILRNQKTLIKLLFATLNVDSAGRERKEICYFLRNTAETALMLFRGASGRQLRAHLAAQKDADQSDSFMRYYIETLSLLQTLASQSSTEIQFLMKCILPLDLMTESLESPETPAEAKVKLVGLFRVMYLRNESHSETNEFTELLRHVISYYTGRMVFADSESYGNVPLLKELLTQEMPAFLLALMEDENATMCLESDTLMKVEVGKMFEQLPKLTKKSPLPASMGMLVGSAVELARRRSFTHISSTELNQNTLSSQETASDTDENNDGNNMNHNAFRQKNMLTQFAHAFLDIMDPILAEAKDPDGHASFLLLEERGSQFRTELIQLCNVFWTPFSQGGSSTASDDGVQVLVRLFEVMLKDMTYMANHQSVLNMIVGLHVLNCLSCTWFSSDSGVALPRWLLKDIPHLIVGIVKYEDIPLFKTQRSRDILSCAALDLGISVLSAESYMVEMQRSFYDVLYTTNSAHSFFTQLKSRIQKAEAEDLNLQRIFSDPVFRRKASMSDEFLFSPQPSESLLLHEMILSASREGSLNTSYVEPTHVELVMTLLHLFCEGHNVTFQNYLRFQPESIKSIDMISATVHYIDVAPINNYTIGRLILAVKALAEFVQCPCRANQRLIVDSGLCFRLKYLLSFVGNNSRRRRPSQLQSMKHDSAISMQTNPQPSIAIKAQVTDNMHVDDSPPATLQKDILELKGSSVILLLGLLECVDDPYIPTHILTCIDSDFLIDNMNYLLRLYDPELAYRASLLAKQKQHPIFEDEDEDMALTPFDSDHAKQSSEDIDEEETRTMAETMAQFLYIAYIALSAFDKTGHMEKNCKLGRLWDYRNLKRKVGVIEISRRGVLEKAYFIIPKVCQYLTRSSKEEVIATVNRANLQTQLAGLVDRFEQLYDEMKHQQKLTENFVLNVFRTTLIFREKAFFALGIIINLCILLFYSYECNNTFICGDHEKLINFRLKPGWREFVVVITGIQSFFALSRLWWYIIEREIPRVNEMISYHAKVPPLNPYIAAFVKLPAEQAARATRQANDFRLSHDAIHKFRIRKIDVVRIGYALTDTKLWTAVIMALANILALFIRAEWSKLLLTVHVFEVFAHFKVLQNVMRSITYRGSTLLQTAGLALVMIYLFGVAGFALFPDVFQFGEAEISGGRPLEPNNYNARCTSIWKCTLVILDMGVRKQDIGEAMKELPWNTENPSHEGPGDSNRIYYRMIYTLLFFSLVTTILMNIIFGVIIDTFAELRAKKEQMDLDMSGRCFICGLDRFIFDEVYLKEKKYESYSGGESYVFDQTMELLLNPRTREVVHDPVTKVEIKVPRTQINLTWFPQQNAMVLKKRMKTADEILLEKVQMLELQAEHFDKEMRRKLRPMTELCPESNPLL